MLDVEVGPGLVWITCGPAVVRPFGCTDKFSETPLEMSYGREMNIQFTGNSSGGHSSAVSMPIALSPQKTCDICGIVLLIKQHILEWYFIVASLRHTCANNHAVYQHLEYATTVRWMDYLGKGEVLM